MINIFLGGSYTFSLGSDDGSMLWIDGQLVVSNNNYQGFAYPQQTGAINLTTGEHNIVIGYFQGGGGYSLEAGVSGPVTGYFRYDLGSPSSFVPITPDLVIGSLTGGGNVQLTTGNLIVGTDNSTQPAFTGVISGIGGVLKVGSGTLTLGGVNTYSGTTTIAAGTLRLAASSTNNIPNSPTISVFSSATLYATGLASGTLVLNAGQNLNGVGTVLGTVNAAFGSSISPGANTVGHGAFGAIGTLTFGTHSNLTLASGATLNYDLGAPGTSDLAPSLAH